MITLKLNDIVLFEGRIFRVEKRKFHNRAEGYNERVALILLDQEGLIKLIVGAEEPKSL